jgi:hypothetical protein
MTRPYLSYANVMSTLALLLAAVVFAGCGASASSRAEAHLAAFARPRCHEIETLRASIGFSAADASRVRSKLAEVRRLVRSDRKLPGVVRWLSDGVRLEVVRASYSRLTGEEHRRRLQVESDGKRLGLTGCFEASGAG